VTVAVLPEADEVEIEIDPKELRIDTFCSSGPAAVREHDLLRRADHPHSHGLVVSCQDEKSQIKNKAKALRVLRSRLYDIAMQEAAQGDRAEPVRTRWGRGTGRREDQDLTISRRTG